MSTVMLKRDPHFNGELCTECPHAINSHQISVDTTLADVIECPRYVCDRGSMYADCRYCDCNGRLSVA